ncbi:MAG: cytochrome c biogenesis protein CcdA [Acidimicrobiia bacterium]
MRLVRGGAALLLTVAATLAGAGAAGAADAQPAPDYQARRLGTEEQVRVSDFEGKDVLLLNTWATWCKPCKEEMPDFEALHQRYGSEGLRVVGVNIDEGRGDARVTRFVEGIGVTFEQWRDPRNRFADDFRVLGPPETFLIDREGRITRHWRGQMDPNEPENLSSIQAALAGEAEAAGAAGPVATAGLLIAFGAGLISVLSPCVLPLVPSYASVVAGVSLGRARSRDKVPAATGANLAATGAGVATAPVGGLPGDPAPGGLPGDAPGGLAGDAPGGLPGDATTSATDRGAALRAGLAFVAGFTSVFMTLGILVNRAGAALADNREWLTRAGGVVLVVLGLHLVGILRIKAADRDVRLLDMTGGRAGYLGAFLVGVAFAAGWSPCVGPVLAGILTMAAAGGSTLHAAVLLAAYSAGLAIPFLAAALALDRFLAWSANLRHSWLPVAERVSGVLVLAIGILLLTGVFSSLASWLA